MILDRQIRHRFRSRNAPASLKVVYLGSPAACVLAFPEQKCSGFIEGTVGDMLQRYADRGFRSRNAPASLKGVQLPKLNLHGLRFPEQKCSGFIEGWGAVHDGKPVPVVSGAEMLRLH